MLLTLRATITVAVMTVVSALAACLILIQIISFRAATREAASAFMDAASANAVNRLEGQVSELGAVISILSTNPFFTDSDDRSEVGGAVGLFKTALNELPQADSLYVGYDNGCWLQVRRVDDLDPAQRRRLEAPPGAVYNINLIRPTGDGDLPMRRIFEAYRGRQDRSDRFMGLRLRRAKAALVSRHDRRLAGSSCRRPMLPSASARR